MKEYLTSAAKMDAKMSTSYSRREAPDQASAPESTTAAALAGCGDSSSPHRISDSAGKDGGFISLPPSAGGSPLSLESARATVRRGARRSRWGQRRWDGALAVDRAGGLGGRDGKWEREARGRGGRSYGENRMTRAEG
jgi:hypothetical protein